MMVDVEERELPPGLLQDNEHRIHEVKHLLADKQERQEDVEELGQTTRNPKNFKSRFNPGQPPELLGNGLVKKRRGKPRSDTKHHSEPDNNHGRPWRRRRATPGWQLVGPPS